MVGAGLRSVLAGASDLLLTALLFGIAGAFLATMVYYHWSRNIERACLIETVWVGLFVLTLVYHGGYANTALYWVFPFPAVLFGMLGTRNALIGNGLIMAGLAMLLFASEHIRAEYREEEIGRFYISLLVVVVASWMNEYYRQRSHDEMSELQATREQQANTDPLTLLPNRRFIDAEFAHNLAQKPDDFLPLGVVMCDLDHFKQLNDQFGHQTGDHVLRQAAQRFRQTLRRQDIACRTGGEEFLMFLPDTDLADALTVAEKVRRHLASTPFVVRGEAHQITASFGVAVCHNVEKLEAAVEAADQALYRSKLGGRDQVT